jgi:hypothetical protein
MCKPEPSGAGPPRNPQDEEEGRGAEESGDFDASSEIGEIDRRLNALQTFLKQAKNGEEAFMSVIEARIEHQ